MSRVPAVVLGVAGRAAMGAGVRAAPAEPPAARAVGRGPAMGTEEPVAPVRFGCPYGRVPGRDGRRHAPVAGSVGRVDVLAGGAGLGRLVFRLPGAGYRAEPAGAVVARAVLV